MDDRQIEGGAPIMALSKCMQGSASQWLSQISYPGIKWEDFKELLIQRYGGLETAAATIANLLNSRLAENECLPVYGSRMVTALTAKLQDRNTEEVAVSIVLAHTTQFNSGLQRLLFTKDIKSRNELHQELKAYAYEQKSQKSLALEKIKHMPSVTCHFCGKIGHKMIDCRFKQRSAPKLNQTAEPKTKTTLTCYKCGVVGHISSNCTMPPVKKPFVEKTVNLWEAIAP